MATAVEGERNTKLHWAALKIGNDVRAGKVTEPQALAALGQLADVACRAGLGVGEVRRTIESAYRGGGR